MLRALLIYLSKASWAQNLVMNWDFAWQTASRFVAGTQLEDAIRVVRELNAHGINATLDHLGEHTSTPAEAQHATDELLATLDEIAAADARSNVSIKLTQIGLGLDESLCAQNLQRVLARGKRHGIFIRLDMEDTPYTDKTIELYYQMRKKGFRNLGVVMQAYLHRSEADTRRLLKDKSSIRLVKGAYSEPADKAYPQKVDVDANYDLLAKIMIDAALALKNPPAADSTGRIPPMSAFGTHDDKRITFIRQYAEKVGLPKEALEFQMLYGIRRDLQEGLSKSGFPLRVYVPFGLHWYPYFMRRLAERPANIQFFVSNFFRR
ncbi:MAG TPA: proline dehydrogenase family protein [Anaerolineales bacterium]